MKRSVYGGRTAALLLAGALAPLSMAQTLGLAMSHRLAAIPADEGTAPGRPAPVRMVLGLRETIDHAVRNHPRLRAATADIQLRSAHVKLSHAAFLPKLNVALSAVATARAGEAAAAPSSVPTQMVTKREAVAELAWTLFDFGARRAGLAQAHEQLSAAQASHHAVRLQVIQDAARAYIVAAAAHATWLARQAAESVASESVNVADARYRAGVATRSETLLANTRLAEARLARISADEDYHSALATLAAAIGAMPGSVTAVKGEEMQAELASVPQEDLLQSAMRRHPQVAAAEAHLAAAQRGLSVAQAEGRPALVLQAAFARSRAPAFEESYSRNGSVGVQLQIPLMDHAVRASRMQVAMAQISSSAADVHHAENTVALALRTSAQSVTRREEALRASDALVQAATDALHMARGRYKAGLGSIHEVLDAQGRLADAVQNRIIVVMKLRTAQIELATSLGQVTELAAP